MTKRLRILGLVAIALAVASPVSAAPPQIARISPLALSPGKTLELTFTGQNLAAATSLWTSFAARCEFLPAADETTQKGERLVARVTVPRDEQVGVGAVRLVTSEGVSNPVLVMLDDLATVAEAAAHHAPAETQTINWPTAIDGQTESILDDWFRFHADAGQRLSFEVVAQRLGGKLDAVLRLLTPDGRELRRVDDADGAGGDSRFTHLFESAGEYLLALGDVRHAGGDEYRYRLRVGAFPLVTAAYPPGGPSGSVMSFELAGDGVDPATPVNVAMPAALESPRVASFSVPSPGNGGSGWFKVEASPRGESIEHEPNDSAAEATAATIPGAFNGRLDAAGDQDHFRFAARAGQRVRCAAVTRRLGSSCDLHMTLHAADGAKVAEARQEEHAVLEAVVPADGEYVLHIENLMVGENGGGRHIYRVDVVADDPGFALNAELPQYTAPQGGTFVAKVLAQRRGYDGPIVLDVEGLGDGASLEGKLLEGGEGVLKVRVPAGLRSGELRQVRIKGRPVDRDDVPAAYANQRGPLSALFPNVPSLPTLLENAIAVGIGPPFPPFFELSVAEQPVYFPQLVGESTFDVAIARKAGEFRDAVSLTIAGLPEGVTAEVTPVDDGQAALRVQLKGPADLPEGAHTIQIAGAGKFQEQAQTFSLANIPLQVTKPLVVSISLPAPIPAGGEQPATIRVRRFGSEPQPVRVQVDDGPAGVSAPIFVTIPADASEATMPLRAVADAASGAFDNLVIAASTTVAGQAIEVRSLPAHLEIQAAPQVPATPPAESAEATP
jgi:hypothetical protein